MIVVDTSALCAIVFAEPDGDLFGGVLSQPGRYLIGAPTAFEFLSVLYRRNGLEGMMAARDWLDDSVLEVVPWHDELLTIAHTALARFGGKPAQLNYGDCMSYALAKLLDAPLLYKGGDFALTDIRSAI